MTDNILITCLAVAFIGHLWTYVQAVKNRTLRDYFEMQCRLKESQINMQKQLIDSLRRNQRKDQKSGRFTAA